MMIDNRPPSGEPPRRFFSSPKFYFRSAEIRDPEQRRRIQWRKLHRLLEVMPLCKATKEWAELSACYMGLKQFVDELSWTAHWGHVAEFKRGLRPYTELSNLAKALHCFEIHRTEQWKHWARETGFHRVRWMMIKQDPKALARHRASNRDAQKRARLRRAAARRLQVETHPRAAE